MQRIALYRELEVDPSATFETIDAAWKSLLKRHHPDVSTEADTAHERVKRLNLAHEWLSDPKLRRQYDRTRRQPTVISTVPPPRSSKGPVPASTGSSSASAPGSRPASGQVPATPGSAPDPGPAAASGATPHRA